MAFSEQQRSWFFVAFLLCLLITVGINLTRHNNLEQLNLLIYDLILPLQSPSMSDQIVIIAIDNASISKLGRWPWSRKYHADILDQLTSMSPRAIGIDILFPEPQSSDVDLVLSQAIDRNQRTVLAVAPSLLESGSPIEELLPIPTLALSAAALGHVDTELDIDGSSRQFYLYAGIDDAHWPSLALAMFEIGNYGASLLNSHSYVRSSPSNIGTGWVRQQQALIPFTAKNDQAKSISYADLLAGRVSIDAIQNKYVLIGMTATGYGDKLPTPVYRSHERMPAVELIAQELNGLLQDKLLHPISLQQQLTVSSILIIICVLSIIGVPLRSSVLTTLASISIVLLCSVALLVFKQLWFAPAITLLMIIIAWPIWVLWQHKVSAQQTKKLVTQLEHQSQYNSVTGLPNQVMLETWLRKLCLSEHPINVAGLLVLQFNWSEAASGIVARSNNDSIVQSIANILKAKINNTHQLAHTNGDDFVFLITEQIDITALQQEANKLKTYLHEPLDNGNELVTLVPHIGMSVWPVDGRNSADLLRKAYTAMFKSRMDDAQKICVYSADIGQEIEARSQLEQALSFALERDEFEVYYQAQVDALTGSIIGAEALLRWQNPKLGWVSPDTFIPVAEYSGMIHKIGDWVIKSACQQLKLIKQQRLDPIRISVNLSPIQFSNTRLINEIAEQLQHAEIAAGSFELEVTENALLHNLNTAMDTMLKIKEQGISLAIDDFGTGYSSLQYLQSFPVNRLKIDKCFTQEIGKNTNSDEITRAIISLAKHLGLTVIAEGVETVEQANFLSDNDCDEFQGYLYSKPLPADQFMALIREGILDAN